MKNNEHIVKLTYQNDDIVSSWESPYFDTPLDDLFDGFVGLAVSHTWDQRGVLEAMLGYAAQHIDDPHEIGNILFKYGIELDKVVEVPEK